ncbi:MAG: hypothetical protein HN356_02245 [Calditrichaeota bacterium]|jgi:hypothetical protein|nr:hypothetical protein [Calditrichota bacterium]MBT7618286.1 hypothetical protein [Calditrichota bacterium]MBT7787321.1 hypothetical protein [Calditrichota bacterium]
MIKYLIVASIGLVLIFLAIFMLRSMDPERQIEETDDEFVSAIQNRPSNPGSIVEPDMVKVTYGDSLYHDPSCSWIGKKSKKMTLEKAENLAFEPCSQCVE